MAELWHSTVPGRAGTGLTLLALALAAGLFFAQPAQAKTATSRPGAGGDPLIAAGYVDDGGSGFAVVGSWDRYVGSGYEGDYLACLGGSATATWTFDHLTPGYQYRIWASWTGGTDRTGQGRYAIVDRINDQTQRTLGSRTVDQRVGPDDLTDAGTVWEELGGAYLVRGTALSVELSGDSGKVIADGIRIQRVGNWVAPIGVPQVSFGIDQTHWMYADPAYSYDYGSGPQAYRVGENGPYTHYVDNGVAGATDSGNPFGTPGRPRLTVPTSVPAGSVVEVHGGPYTTNWSVVGDGSASRPVFIRGASMDDRPTVQAGISVKGQYVVLENIYQPGMKSISVANYSGGVPHHVAVRHCEQVGSSVNSSGIALAVYGDVGYDVHDIVLYDNYVHDQGNSENKPETDRHGIAVTRHTNNVWVVDNHVHHSQADGIQVNGWENETTHHIYIGRNTFHDDGENAIDVKEASDLIISQNIMYGYQHVEGAVVNVHCDDDQVIGAEDVWVLFNEIYDGYDGIVSMGVKGDFYAIGNVIHDMVDSGFKSWREGSRHLVNDTIYNVKRGIAHTGTAACEIVNDIISSVSGQHIYLPEAAGASTMNHAVVYQPGGSVSIRWGGGTYGSVSSFISSTGQGAGSIQADPRFVDVGVGDYRLRPDSPGIDAGADRRKYAELFRSLYGLDIAVDPSGASVPQGLATDIGAYEMGQPDGGNRAPVASNDSAVTTDGVPVAINVLSNDSDADGDALSVASFTQPAHGTAVYNGGGTFTYTAVAGYTGPDAFTYKANDGRSESNVATVAITVQPASQQGKLAIVSVTASAYETPNVPANTIDGDLATRWSAQGDGQWIQYDLGSSKTVSKVSIAWHRGDTRASTFTIEVSTNGSAWSAVYNGASSGSTADLEQYDVADATARYVRIVGHGNSVSTWNSITEVEIYGTDSQVPVVVAQDDSAQTEQGKPVTINVLANDSSEGGGVLKVTSFTQPAHGSTVDNGNGTLTYSPAANWYGVDKFAYTASNGVGGSGTATVTIAVSAVPTEVKLPVAAVTASSHETGNAPANTIDGNLATRWSANGSGQWIRYDLGSLRTVSKVCIAWHRGDIRISKFAIEVSKNGSVWTKVYSGASSGSTTSLEQYKFTAVTARFVRIVGYGNLVNSWNSITEVEIHGLNVLATDLNRDGLVNQADLDILLQSFGQQVTAGDTSKGDVNGDGYVGQSDLDMVLSDFGASSPSA